ncbi:MAG: restriction endonuclease subunit S [Chloroflexi bacterium]|nr:restriction endonuclease subunit S [Chloroflexota bacterium]
MTDTVKTLNDVCEFIVDCLHATAPTQDDGYPLIRTPNVGKGRLVLDGAYRVSEGTYEKWTRRAVPKPGDLILAREAPAGNVAIIKDGQQVCLGQRTVHLRPDIKKVDPDFLCYFLIAPQQQGSLLAGATGVTAKHVNMKDIRRLPLRGLPEIRTQHRISSILSAYDDLIENNRRRTQLLEEVARLLYREWFVHQRFPGHEHVAVVDGVPVGWERKRLEEIGEITMGQSPKSIYYNEEGNGLPFHQGVSNFGVRFPTHQVYCTVRKRIANPGDILFSVRAPVGRINITRDQIVVGRGLAAIRSKFAHQNFLFYSLKNHFFKEDMMGSGAIFAAITKADLHGVELMQTSDSIIDMFMAHVQPIDQQIVILHQIIEGLANARDLLLPRLMNGEISI